MAVLLTEGQRLRRELHDRVLQALAAAQRQLELHDVCCPSDPARARRHVATAQVAMREALDELRAVISDLVPEDHAPSLESALRAFAASPMTDGVDIRLHLQGDPSRVPRAVHNETFLILREAICNAVVHGAPTTVLVGVDFGHDALRAWVQDDGAGFDTDTVALGVGLASMRERAALLGGRATVATSTGGTTRLDLVVPHVRGPR